jgi:hypothetical protein
VIAMGGSFFALSPTPNATQTITTSPPRHNRYQTVPPDSRTLYHAQVFKPTEPSTSTAQNVRDCI